MIRLEPILCPYCGQHWTPKSCWQKHHGCPEDKEAARERKRAQDRAYSKRLFASGFKRDGSDFYGNQNKPRGKRSRYHNAYFIPEGTRLYPCQSRLSRDCYGESVNRYHCPACLPIAENREFGKIKKIAPKDGRRDDFLDDTPIEVLGHELPPGWFDNNSIATEN